MKKNTLIQCGDHYENQLRILPLAQHLMKLETNLYVLMYTRKNSSRIFEENGISVIYFEDFDKSKSILEDEDIIDGVQLIESQRFPFKYSESKRHNERLNISRTVNTLNSIIVKYELAFIFVWNGFTGNIANALRLLAEKHLIQSFFLERGLWPRSLFVDSTGVNGGSYLSRKIIHSTSTNKRSAVSEPIRIFVPLQVQTDTNILLYSDEVKTMRKLILCVYMAALEIEKKYGVKSVIVVRSHPEEVESNLNLPDLSGIIYDDSTDLPSVISSSDVVVTINSTVGMEALRLGVPVVQLGKAIYSDKGLTWESNVKHLSQNIFNAISHNVDKGNVESFCQKLREESIVSEEFFPSFIAKKMGVVKLHCDKRTTKNKIVDEFKQFLAGRDCLRIQFDIADYERVNISYRENNVLVSLDSTRKLLQMKYDFCGQVVLDSKPDLIVSCHPVKSNSTKFHVDKYMNLLG